MGKSGKSIKKVVTLVIGSSIAAGYYAANPKKAKDRIMDKIQGRRLSNSPHHTQEALFSTDNPYNQNPIQINKLRKFFK